MATIELAGSALDVWEAGDGPSLLFLHGAGGFRADHPFLAARASGQYLVFQVGEV